MSASDWCKNLPAKKPHFFKVVLENTMQEKKLGIPRKFVVEHGRDLPEYVTIEVPDGAQWQIKLTKTEDGQVWLDQGWLDFAKHYCISCGHFLVFNPQEVSKFLVVIFDMTGMEIKYAPKNAIELGKKHELENATRLICHKSTKRKRDNSLSTCGTGSSVGTDCGTLRLKKARRDADLHVSSREFEGAECGAFVKKESLGDADSHVLSQEVVGTECGALMPKKSQGDADLNVLSQESEGGCTSSTGRYQCNNGQKMRFYAPSEKAKMLEKAQDFQSSKPYFKVLIQPSAIYIKNKDVKLEVPFEFAKQYFSLRNGNVILQNEDGRSWAVSYRSETVKSRSRPRTKLAKGWKYFSAENNLAFGDVCVFEMIKESEMTLNVVIFRAWKRGDMPIIPRNRPMDGRNKKRLSSKQKAMLLGKAQDFKSTKPYFKVIMQSSSVYRDNQRAGVYVPAKFAKKYLINKKGGVMDVTIYDERGSTWSVSCYFTETRDTPQVRLITGWNKFAKDNNLRVDDVCVFEMENCKNVTFKVTIFRKDDAANCYPSPVNSARLEIEENVGGSFTDERSSPILSEVNKSTESQNDANEYTATNPWFALKMKYSYIKGSCLTVPRSFARNYIKAGTSTIKLNAGDKSWEVKLFNYQDGASRISGGWIAFAKENALKPMDICKFELIDWIDCTFRVSIIRDTWKSPGLENGEGSGGNITCRRSCRILQDKVNRSTKVVNEAIEATGSYPWFTVEMEDANIHGWSLSVPTSFAKKFIKTTASTIKLNVEDKSWRVNLFKSPNGACKLSAGWTAFVKENSLKPKDSCKFELVQRNDCFFRVSISRNTTDSK